MKIAFAPTIFFCLVIAACDTPSQNAAADYAPQQLSAKELNAINFNTFFGDSLSSIAGDYTFAVSGKSIPTDEFFDTMANIEMSIEMPIAIGQDGFEVTVRSSDLQIEGLPLPSEIPLFEARITASNSSGIYMHGSGDGIDDQGAFINTPKFFDSQVRTPRLL